VVEVDRGKYQGNRFKTLLSDLFPIPNKITRSVMLVICGGRPSNIPENMCWFLHDQTQVRARENDVTGEICFPTGYTRFYFPGNT
jgi:hypothetical protein